MLLLGCLGLVSLLFSNCALRPLPRPITIPLPGFPSAQPQPQPLPGQPLPQPNPYPQPKPYPQPGQPTQPVTSVPSTPTPNPIQASVRFLSLQPQLVSASGKAIRGSTSPVAPPKINGMVKASYPSRVAYRDVEVQFQPAQAFANTAVRWQFSAYGGSLRGKLPNGVPTFSTPPGAAVPFNRLDARGRTTVRVSLPPKGLNRGRVVVSSAVNPQVSNALDFVVPSVVVIDPGHGGHVNLAGSSANNSQTPQGVLEKDLTLEYGKELSGAVTRLFEGNGLPVRVAMTRDRDVNVTGRNRAEVARDVGADAFVTIHFNGFDGTKRGTLEVQRSTAKGNVNFHEDTGLATRMITAAVNALRIFDSQAYKREPVAFATSVSNDSYQGNTASDHPVRHAYLELEFIDNPQVAHLLTGSTRHRVRATVAQSMAQAIFEDIASHRG